jgi:hypothetical protein
MSPHALETLVYLREQEMDRERKMAALAAQLPPNSHAAVRHAMAHMLFGLANYLDPERTASSKHAAQAAA